MGDKPVDGEKSEPSLELPSLFRRRNKDRPRRARPRAEPPDAGEGSASTLPQEHVEPPSNGSTTAFPPEQPAGEPGWAEPAPAPFEGPVEPAQPQVVQPPTAVEAEPTEVLAEEADQPSAAPRRRAERRARQRRSRPTVPPLPAAVVTGVLVGLFGALLTYGSLRGCDAVRGTQSCGGGPGLLLLLVITVLMVLAGAVLLRLFKVPEPRSTSFLAVGLTAVVVLVALMEQLFSTWMFLVVPLISAVTYAVAQWVTTRYVELPDQGPEHDIR